jgi:putative DNA primase/helicase
MNEDKKRCDPALTGSHLSTELITNEISTQSEPIVSQQHPACTSVSYHTNLPLTTERIGTDVQAYTKECESMQMQHSETDRLAKSIPSELQDWPIPQWVAYKLIFSKTKVGKTDKIPYDVKSNRPAKVNSPETWATFSTAVKAAEENSQFAGVGFVFTDTDPFVGVDLDDCINEDGSIQPWAQEIVDKLGSYTEYSPSGRGLHILCKGTLPAGGRRSGQVEMYKDGRFLTATGKLLPGTRRELGECTDSLALIHKEYFGQVTEERIKSSTAKPIAQRVSTHNPVTLTASDEKVLRKARGAANSAKFVALYDEGNISTYHSPSEADLALASLLACWTDKNPVQMDRLFRSSALYRPKWDELRSSDGVTYGQMTIQRALKDQQGWVLRTKTSVHTTTQGGSNK